MLHFVATEESVGPGNPEKSGIPAYAGMSKESFCKALKTSPFMPSLIIRTTIETAPAQLGPLPCHHHIGVDG